jgi:hypothetical protein
MMSFPLAQLQLVRSQSKRFWEMKKKSLMKEIRHSFHFERPSDAQK